LIYFVKYNKTLLVKKIKYLYDQVFFKKNEKSIVVSKFLFFCRLEIINKAPPIGKNIKKIIGFFSKLVERKREKKIC